VCVWKIGKILNSCVPVYYYLSFSEATKCIFGRTYVRWSWYYRENKPAIYWWFDSQKQLLLLLFVW